MYKSLTTSKIIGGILIFTFTALGWQPILLPTTFPPTVTPSLTETVTDTELPGSTQTASTTETPAVKTSISPTPTYCQIVWNWAYGTVTARFIDRVRHAMRDAKLKGSVRASTFGETDGCGGYHPMDVDYFFTVRVQDLNESENLADVGSDILRIAERFVDESPAPNLGQLQLIFKEKDGQQCEWRYQDGAWNAVLPFGENFILCPAPVSRESQRLANALDELSVDLACETTAITTNTLQSILECGQPGGVNSYTVTVTLRLNEQVYGYETSCFHGYTAFESDDLWPATNSNGGKTYYERHHWFESTISGVLYKFREQIQGGQNVTFPIDLREMVYQRAMQEGLIPGEGSDCQ